MRRINKVQAIQKANLALQKRTLNEDFGEPMVSHPIYALTDVMKTILKEIPFNELEKLTQEALAHIQHEIFPNGKGVDVDDNAPVESSY
tara:strand:+ start:25548 stop:25814 length:267 start_codon:yes stop_codon:yes gene_type:complete